jgi:hypothetical protein
MLGYVFKPLPGVHWLHASFKGVCSLWLVGIAAFLMSVVIHRMYKNDICLNTVVWDKKILRISGKTLHILS